MVIRKRISQELKSKGLKSFEKFPAEVARAFGSASISDFDRNAGKFPAGYDTLNMFHNWMDRFPLSANEV